MKDNKHKKKSNREEKRKKKILGVKIKDETFGSLIVALIILVIFGSLFLHNKFKLKYGKTEVVYAEIMDVGIGTRGGHSIEIGYIKFKYYINGKEIIHWCSSYDIKENIEMYNVGDCIEVLASTENENVFEWNESKGTFKCN